MKITVKFAALLGVASLLAACNTMEGFGKDLKAAGDKISASASKDSKEEPKKSSAPAPATRY
ncbi:MAG: entericidin A/B family lipoprotein [Burkholderiaceae bacterium]